MLDCGHIRIEIDVDSEEYPAKRVAESRSIAGRPASARWVNGPRSRQGEIRVALAGVAPVTGPRLAAQSWARADKSEAGFHKRAITGAIFVSEAA